MSESQRFDELEAALTAVFAGSEVPQAVGAEARDLAMLAGHLLGLPDEGFRARLKVELVLVAPAAAEAPAGTATSTREGFHTVTPYLTTAKPLELIEFCQRVFGATGTESTTGSAGGLHAETRIGDSMLMIGGMPGVREMPMALHLYVEDADAVYRQALEAGAASLYEPTDQPYGDREAGVKDPFGNVWFVATHGSGASHRPVGLRSVTPTLLAVGAAAYIGFLESAFAARELERDLAPDGTFRHARIGIGDSVIELGEAHGLFVAMPAAYLLYVEDADAWCRRAIAAGAVSISEPSEQGYGRMGTVKDPQGNTWYVTQHREV